MRPRRSSPGTANYIAHLRRATALLLAVCVLWTLTAALPVAASVRPLEQTTGYFKAGNSVTTDAVPETCACLQCSAGPNHEGGISCCCTPALGKEAPPQTSACELRALCDEGAPDALLAGVSWCPPAVLPSAAGVAALPGLLEAAVLPAPAENRSFSGGAPALPETPPRLS
jgi:hypothetical protein